MVNLSVNLNKIALLRNSRGENNPNLLYYAQQVLKTRARGITVHPRPDERHITFHDVIQLKKLISQFKNKELNVEGNPFSQPRNNYPGFKKIIKQIHPQQVTLVPDKSSQLTSYYGWDLKKNYQKLKKVINYFKRGEIRVSLFVDHQLKNLNLAKTLGADRLEMHTGYYANNFQKENQHLVLKKYLKIAESAKKIGLGLNAGHDLNLKNLSLFLKKIPEIKEVSIGHALISKSLEIGFPLVLKQYLKITRQY